MLRTPKAGSKGGKADPPEEDANARIFALLRVKPLDPDQQRSCQIDDRGATTVDFGINDRSTNANGADTAASARGGAVIRVLGDQEKKYSFDAIFDGKQDDTYERLRSIVDKLTEDKFNVIMFSYGQTDSGKTFTMFGDVSEHEGTVAPQAGITPRLLHDTFRKIDQLREEGIPIEVKASFFQNYNENVYDLVPENNADVSKSLKVREDGSKKVFFVENLSAHEVGNTAEAMEVLRKGMDNLSVSSTKMNRGSSRSHSIFVLEITETIVGSEEIKKTVSKLTIVDLAGSESEAVSTTFQQKTEAKHIRKSLSTLGRVINSLVNGEVVSWRECQLTKLLKDSIDGGAFTCVIGTISPNATDITETKSTLKFLDQTMNVEKTVIPSKPVVLPRRRMTNPPPQPPVSRQRSLPQSASSVDEVARLRAELEEARKRAAAAEAKVAKANAAASAAAKGPLKNRTNAVEIENSVNEELKEEVADLRARLKKSEAEKEEMKEEMKVLCNEKSALEERIKGEKDEKIAALRDLKVLRQESDLQVETIRTRNEELEANVARLEIEKAAVLNEGQLLRDELELKNAQIEVLNKDKAALEEQLNDRLEEAVQEKDTLSDAGNANVSDLEVSVAGASIHGRDNGNDDRDVLDSADRSQSSTDNALLYNEEEVQERAREVNDSIKDKKNGDVKVERALVLQIAACAISTNSLNFTNDGDASLRFSDILSATLLCCEGSTDSAKQRIFRVPRGNQNSINFFLLAHLDKLWKMKKYLQEWNMVSIGDYLTNKNELLEQAREIYIMMFGEDDDFDDGNDAVDAKLSETNVLKFIQDVVTRLLNRNNEHRVKILKLLLEVNIVLTGGEYTDPGMRARLKSDKLKNVESIDIEGEGFTVENEDLVLGKHVKSDDESKYKVLAGDRKEAVNIFFNVVMAALIEKKLPADFFRDEGGLVLGLLRVAPSAIGRKMECYANLFSFEFMFGCSVSDVSLHTDEALDYKYSIEDEDEIDEESEAESETEDDSFEDIEGFLRWTDNMEFESEDEKMKKLKELKETRANNIKTLKELKKRITFAHKKYNAQKTKLKIDTDAKKKGFHDLFRLAFPHNDRS